ncbi:hypothetical protein [Geomicrobium sp. JCM 19055]|uniref:hypothetical protein n=1 Tax=Geomicrobium sp. JCM 19055 TaxID=1460649 RepID=UPI0005A970A3|nr:hypothetical protein [Geomicrobium sp. JCM 19055]
MYLTLHSSLFTERIVDKIGSSGLTTLLCLATYMNEDGVCRTTQKELSERMGVHINSMNKYLNDLLEVTVDGEPLVTKQKINQNNYIYIIHPISKVSAIFISDDSKEVSSSGDNGTQMSIG